ncbi:MAG: Flp pilus assembly protein CpaB, partial [Rhodospirillaceae bacterium]
VDSFIIEDEETTLDSLVGAEIRAPVSGGIPLQNAQLVFPGDRGFLAAVLTPGLRAVSVPVTDTSGIAGFVFPGDRVDVMLSVRLQGKDDEGSAETRYAGLTVLTNVRVLAMDQRTETINGEVSLADTATLEIWPKDSEKVALALAMGELSLALNSLVGETALSEQMDRWHNGPSREAQGQGQYPDGSQNAAYIPAAGSPSQRLAIGPTGRVPGTNAAQHIAWQQPDSTPYPRPAEAIYPVDQTGQMGGYIPTANPGYGANRQKNVNQTIIQAGPGRNYTMDWELFTIGGQSITALGLNSVTRQRAQKPVTVFRGDSDESNRTSPMDALQDDEDEE